MLATVIVVAVTPVSVAPPLSAGAAVVAVADAALEFAAGFAPPPPDGVLAALGDAAAEGVDGPGAAPATVGGVPAAPAPSALACGVESGSVGAPGFPVPADVAVAAA